MYTTFENFYYHIENISFKVWIFSLIKSYNVASINILTVGLKHILQILQFYQLKILSKAYVKSVDLKNCLWWMIATNVCKDSATTAIPPITFEPACKNGPYHIKAKAQVSLRRCAVLPQPSWVVARAFAEVLYLVRLITQTFKSFLLFC